MLQHQSEKMSPSTQTRCLLDGSEFASNRSGRTKGGSTMNSEKVIIVYYSRTGHTRKLAIELSHRLNCTVEEIKTTSQYSGPFGFPRACFHAAFRISPETQLLRSHLADFDLVVLCGPVWMGSICMPLRSFMVDHISDFKNVAFVVTQGGNGKRKKIFDKMKKIIGRTPLAVLSVSETDFKSGLYKNSISAFISMLSLINPKIDRRRIAESSPLTF